ncbi:ribosomal RNA small subunit methyltransferase NEP1, putative [Babesia caballi]|uniref:Ribosomal RNA small subunit methyltransferase NEP1, putative n=1 Tax=Babesia caballi TaxID=5871 RepID=A0AAV4LW35_BABCB|nr:ribosomal RNA small subunit methyltransferase NEP1, putative [Babesia caballi]
MARAEGISGGYPAPVPAGTPRQLAQQGNAAGGRVDETQNGLLKVLIRTEDNTLIDVSPHLRVPRTPKQFDSMLVHLLYKRVVKSQERDTVLMRVVKNDIEVQLPTGARRFGLSVGGRPVKLKGFCQQFKGVDYPVVFHVGAVSHSQPKGTVNQVEEVLSISSHGLTAAHVCAKICSEFEFLNDVG